jgi:hypothetical protein
MNRVEQMRELLEKAQAQNAELLTELQRREDVIVLLKQDVAAARLVAEDKQRELLRAKRDVENGKMRLENYSRTWEGEKKALMQNVADLRRDIHLLKGLIVQALKD